ncbi:hypothetical protein ACF0H5_022349 [Mactra antiquata]
MGIDIDSYRCRIGCFIRYRGGGGIVSINDSSVTIQTLLFIRLLLVIAGIERNPGPPHQVFIFRYQYLLIEVGTEILRKVFDHIVGPDYKVYLDNNPVHKTQFNNLCGNKLLNPGQLNLLPPIDNTPSSKNFDITLLCCLLRNTCGLCVFKDQVWKNPQPSDKRVEASITRLRECRNNMLHSGSVVEDETVLSTKWNELCSILQELSNYCGFTDLQDLIKKASEIKIDDQLKEKFDNVEKEWRREIGEVKSEIGEVKRDIGEVKSEIDEVKRDIGEVNTDIGGVKSDIGEVKSEIDEVKTDIGEVESEIDEVKSDIGGVKSDIGEVKTDIGVVKTDIGEVKSDIGEVKSDIGEVKSDIGEVKSEMSVVHAKVDNQKRQIDEISAKVENLDSCKKQQCDEYVADIQRKLIDIYQEDVCSSLPLCPLLEDEKGHMLDLYEIPKMHVVNYHNVEKHKTDKSRVEPKEVKTCKDLFHDGDKECKNIYLTGSAGVGKTSFCKFIALLWCKSKSNEQLADVDMQKYVDYLARFDFVFYVNLRDTYLIDLIKIIVNELFYSESDDKREKMYRNVEQILNDYASLVIMDGLDEWTPQSSDKRKYEIPVRPKSPKCVYFTTCRPYKIENVRLSRSDLDHQVEMTGLGETEIESYVENLIKNINDKYEENKDQKEFMDEVKKFDFYSLLHIPMITSHLIMLWFDRPLISMSRTLIYGNIIDMLFKLAYNRKIAIPSPKSSISKLPDPFCDLSYLKKHFSQVEQLCMLSYRVLFDPDTNIASLVFTKDQLASEPYCMSEAETNFFCTIGILSKNKVIRKFGKQELKLSFLHKSYLEFFAAMYASTLETSQVLEPFNKCRTINDVLKYENFLIFYAGLLNKNFVSLITRIYSLISVDLDLARTSYIFYGINVDSFDRLKYLIKMILKCYIEGSSQADNVLPLEDFIFSSDNFAEHEALLKLLVLNKENAKSLYNTSITSIFDDKRYYYDDFNTVNNLQVLRINYGESSDDMIKLNKLIIQNKSSLHTLSIIDYYTNYVHELPIKDLHHLTSLSLESVHLSHDCLLGIIQFLSNNNLLKHIELCLVCCTEHDDDKCTTLDLTQCNNLIYFNLSHSSIKCSSINPSCLEYLILDNYKYTKFHRDICKTVNYLSELKWLEIEGYEMSDDYDTIATLITNVQYLSKIEHICLAWMKIPDNVDFFLHPNVKKVCIKLITVSMTASFFRSFIDSCIDKCCDITVEVFGSHIRQYDGDTYCSQSVERSVDYMFEYINQFPTVNVIDKLGECLIFTITDGQ